MQMNEKLQKDLSSLENMIAIQKDCVLIGDPSKEYMHGMLNGLICAHSVFSGDPPNYHSAIFRKKRKNVRHKSLVIKKERG
jgi:hypothetical protein